MFISENDTACEVLNQLTYNFQQFRNKKVNKDNLIIYPNELLKKIV